MSPVALQQSIIALIAAGLLVFVIRSARRGRLSFGTATLWAGIAVIAIAGAALVPEADRFAEALGVIPAALLAGIASSVLGGIVLLLSLRMTKLEDSLQRTVEVLAGTLVTPALEPPSTGSDDEAVLAIVPAYNEEQSVSGVVEGLLRIGLAVLVVDDGSSDGTATAARRAGASVLELPTNLGVGGALRAGISHAVSIGFRAVIQCDADGQHPAEEVAKLVETSRRSKAHLLIGSRFLTSGSRGGVPIARRIAMLTLAVLGSRAAQRPLTDPTSGLRIIRQPLLGEVACHLPRHYLGDTFELAVSAGRTGYAIDECPVTMKPRLHGRSSASVTAAVGLTLRAILVVLLGAHLAFAPLTEQRQS